MPRSLKIDVESFPLAEVFTIARGSRTSAEVIACTIDSGTAVGRGECVPYRRYGETLESVREEIEAVRREIEAGADRMRVQHLLSAGAARNALDCALWDLEAKASGTRVAERVNAGRPTPLTTAFTISLAEPEEMAAKARAASHRPLLKIKLGGENDAARLQAVAAAAPQSRLIVDANEGWTEDNIHENLAQAVRCNVALIEQPLPAGKDAILRQIEHSVPICADESVHTRNEIAALKGLYDAVNIKLDKTGGLTEALELRKAARAAGFSIMVGCMVGTSLAMAPAMLLAQDADYVDLDGPLLLARDRQPALSYDGSLVSPPAPALWG